MSSALLVIDVQQALSTGPDEAFESRLVIRRINGAIGTARAAGAPVLFIQHEAAGGALAPESEGWQLDPQLDARPCDRRFGKQTADAFHQTGLLAWLQQSGTTHLVLCGLQTEFCVDTTARRALALGFAVTLVADGHSTVDNGILTAAQIRAHHNLTLSRIDSFGPRVSLVPAAQLRLHAQETP